MLTYILYGLFILSCFILVVVILLQPGKSDAGALFSSSLSSTAFGPRGTASLLAKITIGAAAAFMLIALTLGLPVVTGSRSVLESTPAPVASPSPSPTAEPAASQAAPASQSAPATQSPTSQSAPAASPAASPAATK
ncbi:MAG TPA: preprotein translocase subunit SecG [Pyrinomonadaceae bacterium]|nr:preprotein translocase subunit SecG [Pyrinomonadaceae bacterium]